MKEEFLDIHLIAILAVKYLNSTFYSRLNDFDTLETTNSSYFFMISKQTSLEKDKIEDQVLFFGVNKIEIDLP